MKKPHLLTLLVPVLALFGAVAATAQTPDWMTPADETICDMETGAAFGWCNAYCEAMDCDLANDNDPLTEPSASQTACDKVRDKFIQTTGEDLPCEVDCPCYDLDPTFMAVVDGDFPAGVCFDPAFGDNAVFICDDSDCEDGAAAVLGDPGEVSLCASPTILLPIDAEQGEDCAQLLRNAATNLYGLTCVPGP